MASENKRNARKYDRNKSSNRKSSNRKYGDRDKKVDKHDTGNEEIARTKEGFTNDPNYYYDNAALLEQTSRLGFEVILGDTYMDAGYREPTIVTADVMPSPGSSYYVNEAGVVTNERDGLNLAMTDFYTTLSATSGRASAYAPQDVGTLILAMSSIIEQIEHWRRVVGVARVYNERNDTMPLRLLEALGVTNGVNFSRQLDLFVDYLNTAITSFNTLPIPGNVAFLLKSRDIFQKVYFDAPVLTAQIIALKPAGYWLIDETSYSGGTILKWTTMPTVTNPSDLGYLITMVDAILNSSTYQVIRSDVLNVAMKTNMQMWKLDPVTTAYAVLPAYDPAFMVQLHNATIMGVPSGASLQTVGSNTFTPSNDVYPDASNNALVYNPMFQRHSALQQWSDIILDMPTDNPTPVDILEATRFIAQSGWTYDDGSVKWAINSVLPDHFITSIAVLQGTYSNTAKVNLGSTFITSVGANASYAVQAGSALSQCGHAPRMVWIDESSTPAVPYQFWDVEYFTHLPISKLRRMNRIIYQGLFKFRF